MLLEINLCSQPGLYFLKWCFLHNAKPFFSGDFLWRFFNYTVMRYHKMSLFFYSDCNYLWWHNVAAAAAAEASKLNWQKVLYAMRNALQARDLSLYVLCVRLSNQLKTELQHKKNCTKSSLAFQLQLYKLDTAFHLIS